MLFVITSPCLFPALSAATPSTPASERPFCTPAHPDSSPVPPKPLNFYNREGSSKRSRWINLLPKSIAADSDNPARKRNLSFMVYQAKGRKGGTQGRWRELCEPLVQKIRAEQARNCASSAVPETAETENHPDFLTNLSVSVPPVFFTLTDRKRTDRL